MADNQGNSKLSGVEADRQALKVAQEAGFLPSLRIYLRLSGPGWLQSAITLGGGSLAGGLYLGVLSGYGMMWLQPLAMLLGIAMLASIAYVTLSTGRRPFRLVTEEVNPVLGWGWAIATLMANIVWCLPQFSLGTAALQQNLFPSTLGDGAGDYGKVIAVSILASVALITIVSYERGGKGMVWFETILKMLVGIIVLCFVGVVFQLTGVEGGIQWKEVFAGFIPRLSALIEVPAAFSAALGSVSETASDYWSGLILGNQRDVMLTAVAAAVGINMTFLLPNSLLDRGWDRQFRRLSIFDLATGLFIPFLIATSCVVMASVSRFHGQYDDALVAAVPSIEATTEAAGPKKAKAYIGALNKRLANEFPEEAPDWTPEESLVRRRALSDGDRQLAAMLIKRDAFDLAQALEPLTGKSVAQWVFGCGVVAMSLSTIVVLMLINGYVVTEVFNLPRRGWAHFGGTLIPLFFGALAPFFWQEAMFWLAVPTSVFGMMLLPIAYFAFFFLMNNKKVLGDAMPTGFARLLVNLVLLASLSLALFGACWSIWSRTGPVFPGYIDLPIRNIAIGFVVLFVALAAVFRKKTT